MVLPLSTAELAWLFPYTSPAGDSPERAAFRLARLLRHNRRLLLQYEESAIRALCRDWCPHAARYFADPGSAEPDDAFELVRDAWERARFPLGVNPLAEAIERARTDHADYPAPPKYGPTHALIYRTVCHLNTEAVRNQSPEFFLSSHALARAIGVRQSIVYRALRRMEEAKILTAKERGTPHKATRYYVFVPIQKV